MGGRGGGRKSILHPKFQINGSNQDYKVIVQAIILPYKRKISILSRVLHTHFWSWGSLSYDDKLSFIVIVIVIARNTLTTPHGAPRFRSVPNAFPFKSSRQRNT